MWMLNVSQLSCIGISKCKHLDGSILTRISFLSKIAQILVHSLIHVLIQNYDCQSILSKPLNKCQHQQIVFILQAVTGNVCCLLVVLLTFCTIVYNAVDTHWKLTFPKPIVSLLGDNSLSGCLIFLYVLQVRH